MMGTEIFKIDASWAEKLTKTRVQFLLTPTVINLYILIRRRTVHLYPIQFSSRNVAFCDVSPTLSISMWAYPIMAYLHDGLQRHGQ